MSRIDILYNEYPGEKAWRRFSDCYPDSYPELCGQISIDQDIAQVLLAKLGSVELANQWLRKPLPVLDGECVTTIFKRPYGRQIIRSMVMRMP